MMPRRARYYNRNSDDDEEFELEAFRENANRADDHQDDMIPDSNSEAESGLGESPEDGFEESDSGDDSEAPEDIGFEASRETERKRMEDILSEIKKDRAERKDKLRKKDELFKQQKHEKLAALAKRKLPEDVLEAVANKTERKKQKKEPHKTAAGVAASEDGKEDKDKDSNVSNNEADQNSIQEFLPLDLSSNDKAQLVNVIALNSEKRTGTLISEKAASFKQSMLYGARIRRIDTKHQRAVNAKRKARRQK